MSSHAVLRERFIVTMRTAGMPRLIAKKILLHAQTIQRGAELACSSDAAERSMVTSARAERLIRAWCALISAEDPRPAFVPVFHGDPRGACVKIRVPSGAYDDTSREGICVPTR